ncbi:hypothetical protein B9H04_02430 [Halorubrum ezzemoulense DSM 17463]|uniref:NodB homology domain-containing protein n=1 Tax=Halorubrum ezzemoulense DSM 17463 TaxID=1121945 RepID=A0A1X4HBC0_HALEZ|nr:polysaccharide deacetylase family protein [Halorubrum ezzemoulense]OSP10598.1 hypothetical protein B9H04_02430 [Halorubrum ezzemoulense DSM 17463]
MTVCLTGDVHHMSLETRDQEYMDQTEVEAAIEYAEIAAEYDVPVTLFVTGKAAEEEPERVKRLAAMENIELGGHNYWAFTTPVHTAWRALEKVTDGRIGSWNGPRPFQAHEIRRTLDVFSDLGVTVTAWRDHAYRHDSHTVNLLAQYGVTHFSDTIEPDGDARTDGGLTMVPINTPPDHDHIYHSFRTSEYVAANDFNGPFGSEAREADAWLDWVLSCVADHVNENCPATVLAHPACMNIADEFDAFERLCERAATELEPVTMSAIEA